MAAKASPSLSSSPLVCVIWDDAHMSLDEYTQDEITRDMHKPSRVRSFGLMVRHDATGVTLATDEGEADQKFRKVNFIPAGMIVEIIDFGLPRRRQTRPSRRRTSARAPTDVRPDTSATTADDPPQTP